MSRDTERAAAREIAETYLDTVAEDHILHSCEKVGVRSYKQLVAEAQKAYPKLAKKPHSHHVIPRYLGGAENGPTVPLDAAYLQQITNAFRKAWPYGQKPPNPAKLREIMDKVYSKFPLPPGTSQ